LELRFNQAKNFHLKKILELQSEVGRATKRWRQ